MYIAHTEISYHNYERSYIDQLKKLETLDDGLRIETLRRSMLDNFNQSGIQKE